MNEKTSKVWNKLLEVGRKSEPEIDGDEESIANKLDKDDVNTILATMEYFGATDIWLAQTKFDLTAPRYRIFDWLAMSVMGRNDDNREQNNTALKVLVYSYLKVNGDVVKFIADLREIDYYCDNEWKGIEIE